MLQGALLYVGGHLIVVAVAVLFFRMLRREPNLVARREAVFELNSKPVRIEAGEAELAASQTEFAALDRRVQEVNNAVVDRVPLDDPPTTKIAYTLLGGILAEMEAAVFFILSGPVAFLSLPAQAWAFAAPVFSSGWIVLLHVLLGSMVSDKHRPARTVRHAKTGSVLCGVAVIIGAWLTLSGRNITDTSIVEQLAGAGLMILAGLLSLTAAFCTIVATTLMEAQQHERELARLERLRNLYARHIELLGKDLARLRTSTDPTTAANVSPSLTNPVTATAAAPAGIVPTLLVLLFLVGMPVLSHAQTHTVRSNINATATEVPAGVSMSFFARVGACEVLIDLTGSVDRATFQPTIMQTSTMLPLIVDAFHCSLVRLTPFAGDLFVSIDEIAIPRVDPADTCRMVHVNTNSARVQALGLLYPNVAAAHQQQAVDDCIVEKKKAKEQAIAQRRAALDQAAERLRALGNLDPRGPCTALPQAVQRALVRSQHVLSIGDGVPTCTPPPTITRVPSDGHLLFLLVPPIGAGPLDRSNVLLERLNNLERNFLGARALMGPEATSAFWRHVGAIGR